MIIESFEVGALQCNCSILACEKTREAIVVDPGDEPEKIIGLLQKHGLKPKYLIHTHAHLDHVGGTLGVQNSLGGESCLHEGDMVLFENVALQAALFNLPTPPTGKIDFYLNDGDTLKFGEQRLEVFHTPGHTPGSLCFYLPDSAKPALFAGDTLFAGSIGRTDLWGGDFNQIIASIRGKLLSLDDATVVYSGHGPCTTIGQEKIYNPFVGQKGSW